MRGGVRASRRGPRRRLCGCLARCRLRLGGRHWTGGRYGGGRARYRLRRRGGRRCGGVVLAATGGDQRRTPDGTPERDLAAHQALLPVHGWVIGGETGILDRPSR